jgi:hypothetical protein
MAARYERLEGNRSGRIGPPRAIEHYRLPCMSVAWVWDLAEPGWHRSGHLQRWLAGQCREGRLHVLPMRAVGGARRRILAEHLLQHLVGECRPCRGACKAARRPPDRGTCRRWPHHEIEHAVEAKGRGAGEQPMRRSEVLQELDGQAERAWQVRAVPDAPARGPRSPPRGAPGAPDQATILNATHGAQRQIERQGSARHRKAGCRTTGSA